MRDRHFTNPLVLALAALLALAAPGCKKKPVAGDEVKTAEPKADPKKTEEPKTEEPKKEEKKPSAGCKLASPVSSEVTLTKGCALTVTEGVYIEEGGVLTIEPGVKLSFGPDGYLWVRHGRIAAKGTKEAPIVLTSSSKTPAAGDWVGLHFEDQTQAGTTLDWVVLEHAGRKAHGADGAIGIRAANIGKQLSITNTIIRQAEQTGLHAVHDGAQLAKFEGNTFDGCKIPVHVRADVLGSFGPNNKFGAPLEVVGAVTTTQTWPVVDAPIHVAETVKIGGEKSAAILTLPEKATIKFAMSTYLEVGTDGGGGLVAKGVTFTSVNGTPAEGDWIGIFVDDKATGTKLEECTISYAGRDESGGKGAITFNGTKPSAAVKITKTTFKNNKQAAIHPSEGDCGELAKPESGNKSEGVPLCAKIGE